MFFRARPCTISCEGSHHACGRRIRLPWTNGASTQRETADQTRQEKGICAVLTTIRGIIRGSHGASAAVLVARINPVVRGWTNYHRHVACSRVFSSMDNEIWLSLWRWARRRHTNKSAEGVKDKCCPTQGARRWRFSGAFVDASGTKRVTPVFLASSVHFQRHIPIRSDANPFDPEWDAYFQKRRRRPSVARAAFSPEGV